MRKLKTTLAAMALLLFGAAGCADLEVSNPNDPAREQVLVTPSDIQSLVAGSFNTWYNGTYHWTNTFWLSNATFQTAATAANWGNVDHSQIPRVAITNDPAYSAYPDVVQRVWLRTYRSLAAVADGLGTLEEDPAFGEVLDAQGEGGADRLRAFGKLVQGIGHASLALWYDQAFIIDETSEIVDASGQPVAQEPVGYQAVMEAAYGYFQEAIDLAEGATWTIPAAWMSVEVPASELAEIARSWRAVFRASLPRTPSEDVDWDLVLADLDEGLTETWVMDANPVSGTFSNGSIQITGGPNGWAAESYFVTGMADQSGNYQRWLEQPVNDRTAWFGANQDDDPFLIITPDERFPQGNTLAEQRANPGEYFLIPQDATVNYDVAEHFENPSRGEWRWSYYHYPIGFDYWFGIDYEVPTITIEELNLLRAEALLAVGDEDGAAALINLTREEYGLSPVDPDAADDGNVSCVPRLPDDSCGGIMEMLKWEKRLETRSVGLFGLSWYWDGRRWGDLYRGTPLHLPIPAGELQTLQMEVYTLGGVQDSEPNASAGSSYNYPFEND